MKKILIILNGAQAPLHVISSAIEMARTDNALLYALFLVPVANKPNLIYPFVNDLALAGAPVSDQTIEEDDQRQTNDNIQMFRDACTAANIAFRIAPGRDISFDELIRHSAFADLIIADAKADFPAAPSMPLVITLSDLLADAHCPVLLLQQEIKQPKQVILSYDGSFSSIHALKMFSYAFPEWRSVSTCLLSVFPKGNAQLEYAEYIKDWLPQHFDHLKIELLKGEIKQELVKVVKGSGQNTLVVMGAYGRTAVSRLFRKSLSWTIVNETSAALFIAHERINT
jgi:nucleotide-binding universal stress UspA family protein